MVSRLSPAQRLKRHYLLVKGSREAIERALLTYTGLLGWARAAPVFLPSGADRWIVAIERKEVVHARAAFALAPEGLGVIRVSGTIKGLRTK